MAKHKPTLMAGLAAIASLLKLNTQKSGKRWHGLQPKTPRRYRMLWPASYGTYRRDKHGPLTDLNGNPSHV